MLLGALVLIGGCSATTEVSQARDAEKTIENHVREFDTAWVTGDVQTIRRLRADDYRSTFLDGKVYGKEIGLKEIESGQFKLNSGASDDLEVRVFNDTAIVTGRWRAEGTFDLKPFTTNERFTIVFLHRRGVWQIVAEHVARNQDGEAIFVK
jgi:ketosteroid isomerase-like protein